VLEAEGLEHEREAGRFVDLHQFAHPLAQHRGGQVAGVDAVTERDDGRQHFTLVADRLAQRGFVVAQRVAASGFRKAGNQCVVARVQEQRLQLGAVAQHAHHRRQGAHALARTHVHRDRDAAGARFTQMTDQLRQQRCRQIVHAEEAGIFQHVERHALAGTGHAADQYKAHRAASGFIHARTTERKNNLMPLPCLTRRGWKLPL
jgi:uncharacterized protein YaaQ